MTNQEELFDDIEMCLKRISDFLGEKGYREVRKYIERYEIDLENSKKVKEPLIKNALLNDEERTFLKNVLMYGNYKSEERNGIVKYIVKRGYFIYLHFSPFHSNSIYIDKNLYFRGLNEDEEYTLKELELED